MSEKTRRLFSSSMLREISIVVFGILIALAADAAWDTRQDRARERDLLLAVEGEIAASRTELAADIAEQEAIHAAVDAALDAGSASFDSVLFIHARSMGYRTYDPPLGVVSGAIASGDLSLIEDQGLRARIAALPAVTGDLQDRQEIVRAWTIDRLWTYRAELDIPADPTAAEAERLVRALSAPIYLNLLAAKRTLLDSAIGDARDLAASLEQIADAIRTHLEG